MSWMDIALSFPKLEEKDLIRFKLTSEEESQMLELFNKAINQTAHDSADIAIITLRKFLVKYPEWSEAILLYGICLAIEGQLKRAHAAFEHALNIGLRKEEFVYLAQNCHQMASEALNNTSQTSSNHTKNKRQINLNRSNPLIQEDDEIRPRKHVQAPILMKAPRRPNRAKMASDKERRELLMKATSSNGEIPDDEIDVSIPKTPAEKLRILVAVLLGGAVVVGAIILTIYVLIPLGSGLMRAGDEKERLAYLQQALYENKDNPDIAFILNEYELRFAEEETQTSHSSITEDTQPITSNINE